MVWLGHKKSTCGSPNLLISWLRLPKRHGPPTHRLNATFDSHYLSAGETVSSLPPPTRSLPTTPRTHRKVPLGSQPLGEVVEGVRLGAHRVAVPVDLVEQVGRFVQAVVADVHVLLFYILGPSCREGTRSSSVLLSEILSSCLGSTHMMKSKFSLVSSLVTQHGRNKVDRIQLVMGKGGDNRDANNLLSIVKKIAD